MKEIDVVLIELHRLLSQNKKAVILWRGGTAQSPYPLAEVSSVSWSALGGNDHMGQEGEYTYVKSAKAVWEDNDADGGWIVEIELFDGEVDCLLPPGKWEYVPKEADPEEIVRVTLENERLKVAEE